MTIQNKINTLVTIGIIATGLVAIAIITFSLRRTSVEAVQEYREVLLNERKQALSNLVSTSMVIVEENERSSKDVNKISEVYAEELRNVVNLAHQSLQTFAGMENLSLEERQSLAKTAIRAMRYNESDYIWINDLHPRMIMHPLNAELDGQDLSDSTDPNGKHPFLEMVETVKKNGEGTVNYLWPKPGEKQAVAKTSYVKLFEPWGWVLGTGVYMDLAEEDFKRRTLDTINTFRYGKSDQDYFYVFSSASRTMLQHPKSSLIGTAIDDPVYTDPAGRQLLLEQLDIALKQGQGFSQYFWPKFGEKEPKSKLTHVRYFEPWNWVLGTGVYTDDIDAQVKAKQEEVSRAIKQQIVKLAGAIFVLLAFIILVTRFLVMNKITTPLENTIDILRDIAEGEGDLTRRLTVVSRDETEEMAKWFNIFVGHLAKLIVAIKADAETLNVLSGGMNQVAENLATGSGTLKQQSGRAFMTTEEVASQINTIAAAAEQMSVHITGVAGTSEQISANVLAVVDSIDKLSRSIQGIAESAREGRAISEQARAFSGRATEAMRSLGEAAGEISAVTSVIKKIAEQTNLLALNATIEAASAGEAGKGFAVVAGEIKELARQSAGAAENIAARISGMQTTTNQSVEIIQQVAEITHRIGGAIETIFHAVDQQNQVAGSISGNVEDAGVSVQDIARSITEISKGASDMSNSAGQVAKGAEFLKQSFQQVDQAAQSTLEESGKVRKAADGMREKIEALKDRLSLFKV